MASYKLLLLKFLKFTAVGFAGLIVDFSTTYFLKEIIKINKFVANAIGFTIAASVNYILNRIWTFESNNQNIGEEYFKFIIVSIIGLAINSFVLWLVLKKFKINFYAAKFMAIVITTIWNFFGNLLFTFGY